MPDFDINKLKKEIESRKTEITTKDVALGKIPDGALPKKNKRAFLNELKTSIHTGQHTDAVEAIRSVNETVEQKKGAPNAAAKNQNKYIPPRPTKQHISEQQAVVQQRTPADEWGIPSHVKTGGYGDGERDDLFEKENAKYDQMMMSGNPVAAQYLKKQPQTQYITEASEPSVDHLLTEKLERNLEKMVESSFKSVLTNIYTKQKIQESLVDFLESEDFVKIVGKAINEIAKRNKAKAGK